MLFSASKGRLPQASLTFKRTAMRVLIATATAGGGHLAAAAALEEAWLGLRPRDELDRIDLVKFFSPLHRKVHADGYLKLVEHAPELWGMVFKRSEERRVGKEGSCEWAESQL